MWSFNKPQDPIRQNYADNLFSIGNVIKNFWMFEK